MSQPPPRWALTVRQLRGGGYNLYWSNELLGDVHGTRDEALSALWHHVQTFVPMHPASPTGRVVCRNDDGWLVFNRGALGQDYACEFSVRELVWEWVGPPPGPPAP